MNYLTTTQAARELGVSRPYILKLLRQSRIIGAQKHGRDWLIPTPVQVVEVPRGRPKATGQK